MTKDLSYVGEVALGPWGCNGGSDWSFRPKYSNQAGNITQITLRFDACGFISSIMFKGESDDDCSTQFGGYAAPDRTSTMDIDYPSEFLTGISGTYGDSKIKTICFETNKRQCLRYGRIYKASEHIEFSVNAAGGAVTGFHGRCAVGYITAIGVYVMPDCLLKRHDVKRKQIASSSDVSRFLSLPRGAGPRGGDGGREWDDGVFSAVKRVDVVLGSTETISALRFCYLRSDGSDFLSPFHGGHSGGRADIRTFSLDKGDDEYLVSIEGFYGPVKGNVNVITSLTFITNKAKYGPVGDEIGTFFTFVNSIDYNRKVVGFHGRSGAYLDAIGLHSEYEMMNSSVAQKRVKEEK